MYWLYLQNISRARLFPIIPIAILLGQATIRSHLDYCYRLLHILCLFVLCIAAPHSTKCREEKLICLRQISAHITLLLKSFLCLLVSLRVKAKVLPKTRHLYFQHLTPFISYSHLIPYALPGSLLFNALLTSQQFLEHARHSPAQGCSAVLPISAQMSHDQ